MVNKIYGSRADCGIMDGREFEFDHEFVWEKYTMEFDLYISETPTRPIAILRNRVLHSLRYC